MKTRKTNKAPLPKTRRVDKLQQGDKLSHGVVKKVSETGIVGQLCGRVYRISLDDGKAFLAAGELILDLEE